ncbi:hypothetical protein [Nostoc sp.]
MNYKLKVEEFFNSQLLTHNSCTDAINRISTHNSCTDVINRVSTPNS